MNYLHTIRRRFLWNSGGFSLGNLSAKVQEYFTPFLEKAIDRARKLLYNVFVAFSTPQYIVVKR